MSGHAASHAPHHPRSLARLIVASAGLMFVAFICAVAGLAYGTGRKPNLAEVMYAFEYALLLYPYFFSREASVEGPPRSDNELWDKARVLPGIMFIGIAVLVVALIPWTSFPAHQWFGKPSSLYMNGLCGMLLLAISPFIYLFLRTQHLLGRNPTRNNPERLFKNKVLLPALATCLVSFSFGWTIDHSSSALVSLSIPLVMIVGFKEVAARQASIRLLWIVFALFSVVAVAFLAVLIVSSPQGKVVIIGILLSLAMGVAEVCKRVVRFPTETSRSLEESRDGYTPAEGLEFYLAGANWSSIVFPLLLSTLPLLIVELPIFPIFLLISTQYLHWHFFAPKKTGVVLFWFNVLLGFSLPIILILQYFVAIPTTIVQKEGLANAIAIFALMVAILAFVALFVVEQIKRFIADFFKRDTYLDYDSCFLLFVTVVLTLSVFIALFGIIFDASAHSSEIPKKATEIIIDLFVLLMVSFFMFLTKRPRMRGVDSGTRPEPEIAVDEVDPSGLPTRRWQILFVLTWSVGRLVIGLITAVAVQAIAFFYSDMNGLEIAVQGLPICFTTMAGFVINDIFDREKDKSSFRPKPLATGMLPVSSAIVFAFALTAAALVLAAFISRGQSFLVIAAAIVGIAVYSPVAHRMPLIKGLLTALLCCTPFAYAAEITNINFPTSYYVFLISFIVGRELLLDARDLPGDRLAGLRTLAAYLRPTLSRLLGWSLMIGSVIVVAFLSEGIAQMLFAAALLTLIGCALVYIRNENWGLAWTRLTLVIGVAAVAISL